MSVRPSTYVVKYLIETYILYANFLFSANRCLRSVLTSAKRLEMWLLFLYYVSGDDFVLH